MTTGYKYFLIAFLILIISNLTFAQQGWYQLNTGFNIIYYSVHFINENTGIACTNGSVAKTTNSGANWQLYNTGFSEKISDIKMLNSKTVIGVCDGGLIIKSTNSGLNWFSVFTSAPGYIYMKNLVFPDSLHGYAIAKTNTQTGNLYRTTNGGDNWIMSNNTNPASISFCSPSTGWIHSSFTTGPPFYYYYIVIYKTVNSGETWSTTYSSLTSSINPGPLFFVNETTGYKVIQLGTAYFGKSLSGGSTWSNIYSANNSNINSIYFVNTNKGWYAGDNGKIFFTSNGGSSFAEQQSGVVSNLYSVFFINDSTGWISTTNGIILKTNTGGVTALNTSSNIIPEKYSLSQNYPNPFNPNTVIRYSLIENRFVKLTVYDALGKEVATLVNQKLSPGSYEVGFDGSNFPSGIYFYKLSTDNFNEVKKMMLVK